jgi:hypothetical protein
MWEVITHSFRINSLIARNVNGMYMAVSLLSLSLSRILQSSLQRNDLREMSLTWNMRYDFIHNISLKFFFHWRGT